MRRTIKSARLLSRRICGRAPAARSQAQLPSAVRDPHAPGPEAPPAPVPGSGTHMLRQQRLAVWAQRQGPAVDLKAAHLVHGIDQVQVGLYARPALTSQQAQAAHRTLRHEPLLVAPVSDPRDPWRVCSAVGRNVRTATERAAASVRTRRAPCLARCRPSQPARLLRPCTRAPSPTPAPQGHPAAGAGQSRSARMVGAIAAPAQMLDGRDPAHHTRTFAVAAVL